MLRLLLEHADIGFELLMFTIDGSGRSRAEAESVQWSQITVRLPDVTLSCLDSRTQGPCVVLVHGLAGHAAEWDRTAEVLAARCRVIAFDQRGHGQSSRRPKMRRLRNFATGHAGMIFPFSATRS